MRTSTSDQPVGRDTELAAVRRFVDAVAAGPKALVLEGEPGIGKTTLWRAALAEAATADVRVLVSRPAGA
ncbi:MAG TPA: ATP-binding protein, partial [Candidatus Limnocylindria bacterium]|nr:ATP-binding protein [Candidatus Limnocylindria bacterium]